MLKRLTFSTTAFMLFAANSLAAEEMPPMPPRGQDFWQTFTMIGIALLFFYVILWRPEQKRRRDLEEQRSQLQKGDKVTAMGIIGTVARIDEETVTLKMVDGNKIEFVMAAISERHAPKDESKETASKS